MIDRFLPTVLDLQHLATALALWALASVGLWLWFEFVGWLIDWWTTRLQQLTGTKHPRDEQQRVNSDSSRAPHGADTAVPATNTVAASVRADRSVIRSGRPASIQAPGLSSSRFKVH